MQTSLLLVSCFFHMHLVWFTLASFSNWKGTTNMITSCKMQHPNRSCFTSHSCQRQKIHPIRRIYHGLDWPRYSKGAENLHTQHDWRKSKRSSQDLPRFDLPKDILQWALKKLAPTHLRCPTKALLHPSNRTHCSDIPCSKRPCEKQNNTTRGRDFWVKIRRTKLRSPLLSVCISLFGWELYSDNTIHGTQKSST